MQAVRQAGSPGGLLSYSHKFRQCLQWARPGKTAGESPVFHSLHLQRTPAPAENIESRGRWDEGSLCWALKC